MIENNQLYTLLLLLLLAGGAVSCSVKPVVTVEPEAPAVVDTIPVAQEVPPPPVQDGPDDEDWNLCFSFENGYSDFHYSDTLVTITPKGNYIRKISLSPNKYAWSCGRGSIFHAMDTVPCTTFVESTLDWETEEFVAFKKPCGSYCWTNIIVPVASKGPVRHMSYSAIDMERMNTVSVGDNAFVITSLRTGKEVRFPIDDIDCADSFSLFALRNVTLKGALLSFGLKCENGDIAEHSTEISMIDLLD